MAKNTKQERSMALYEAVLAIKDLDECCRFFDDLCTPTELRSMEQRYDVAAALMQEQVYMEIQEKTGASSATISRVRRNILENSKGGAMRDIITRLGEKPEHCLVVEDSPSGVRAGRAAGMTVCMIPDLAPCTDELRPYCDLVLPSLDDLADRLAAMT